MDPLENFAHEIWIHYRFNEPFDRFLMRNRPSQISEHQATWISVHLENDDDLSSIDDDNDDGNDTEDHEEVVKTDYKDIKEPSEGKGHKGVGVGDGDGDDDDDLNLQTRKESADSDGDYKELASKGEAGDHKDDNDSSIDDKNDVQNKKPNEDSNEDVKEPKKETKMSKKPRRIAMLAEWNELVEKLDKKVNPDHVKELAVKYNILSGKWLIFATSNRIDNIWSTIARGVMEGKLGHAAKVSTRKDEPTRHVICVYSEDFTNEEDVRKLEKSLRDLGITCPMQYKCDAYTLLDIYRDNKFGLAPCVYKSEPPTDWKRRNENRWWERPNERRGSNERSNERWSDRRNERSDGRWNERSDGRWNERSSGRSDGRWNEKSDGRWDGRTDGRSNERSSGRSDGRTDGRWNGRSDGRTDGRWNERSSGRSDGRTDGRTNRRWNETTRSNARCSGQSGERGNEDRQENSNTDRRNSRQAEQTDTRFTRKCYDFSSLKKHLE